MADWILASRNGEADRLFGGYLTTFAKRLIAAERFVFDVAASATVSEVARAKPSSIVEAIHLCRPPYPLMWVEYPFLETKLLLGKEVDRTSNRPTPSRMGYLVEAAGPDLFTATYAWGWPDDRGVNIGVYGMMFSRTGQMSEMMRNLSPHREAIARSFSMENLDLELPTYQISELKEAAKAGELWWPDLSDEEIEAVIELQKYEHPGVSPYTHAVLQTFNRHLAAGLINKREFSEVRAGWIDDSSGESPFLRAALLMMNSRNAVERQPSEPMERLNRKRTKLGKLPLLSYTTVKLALSRVQANRSSDGSGRSGVRAHLVRGHFKIRKTGVFWWSHYVRGTAPGAVKHRAYEVAA